MKKILFYGFLIFLFFSVVVIFCKANYIIASFTDICTYENSQDIILLGHNSRQITSIDYLESKSDTGNLNAFEGIGALFSGLAFLAAFYTLIQQSKNIELAEENNKNSIRFQEYNSISDSITSLQQTLYHLNESYRNGKEHAKYDAKDPNLAGFFSTKIYHDLAIEFEKFKETYPPYTSTEQKEKYKNRIRNQVNYFVQSFHQISYPVRGILSRIDNSTFLTILDKKMLSYSLITSMSHVDNKILQLVYLRESMRTDFGSSATTFSQYFTDDIARIVIKQLTETISDEADQLIFEALKSADPAPQDF